MCRYWWCFQFDLSLFYLFVGSLCAYQESPQISSTLSTNFYQIFEMNGFQST